MGLKFLEEARRRRKKVDPKTEESKSRVLTAAEASEGQVPLEQGLASKQANRGVKYRNYLH